MTQHYLNPDDANDPKRLPNIETFQAVYGDCLECDELVVEVAAPIKGIRKMCPSCEEDTSVLLDQMGWFYWYCMPGCMPDSNPIGPFKTEAEALKHAREE